jgi:assimilatory nitrate reductase catalytic subunit
LFGLASDTPIIAYQDEANGQFRCAAFDGQQLTGAFFLSKEPVAVSRQHVVDLLQGNFEDVSSRWRVISGRASADKPDKGAIICACNSVGINQILAATAQGCLTVEAIGAATQAGTNCGSCRAEIGAVLHGKLPLAAE